MPCGPSYSLLTQKKVSEETFLLSSREGFLSALLNQPAIPLLCSVRRKWHSKALPSKPGRYNPANTSIPSWHSMNQSVSFSKEKENSPNSWGFFVTNFAPFLNTPWLRFAWICNFVSVLFAYLEALPIPRKCGHMNHITANQTKDGVSDHQYVCLNPIAWW